MLLADWIAFCLARTRVRYIFLFPSFPLGLVLMSLNAIIIRAVAVLPEQKLIFLLVLLNFPERRLLSFLKNSQIILDFLDRFSSFLGSLS